MSGLPLEGCRVLDLGIITAGAATSALLADMGAEVIKVESPTYRDPFRLWAANDPHGVAGSMPLFFRSSNRNKMSVSLDLKAPEGRSAFLRLAARSDVVVENFRRGVLNRLALDYEPLRTVNPDIILASISSQGETGPDRGHVSYGTTLEAVGGLAWISGYRGGGPVASGRDLNYPDQVAAIFSAGMIVTAWRASRAGEGGVHLDLSQRELTSFLSGEAFLAPEEEQTNVRVGNSQAPFPVQDCFRDADGQWIAVTVESETAAALGRHLGLGPSASEEDLHTALVHWISGGNGGACIDALARLRIAAAPVLDGRTLQRLEGRLWETAMLRAADGEPLKGFPFQYVESPLTVRRDAPQIGADTAEVLMRIGGYSSSEIAALARDGIIELASL